MMLSQEALKKKFRAHRLRFTSERYAVYKALASAAKHPSVEEIYLAIKESYPTLSLNTVYNTLEALKSIGVASEISLWHDKARFDANLTPHHHLVCIRCRKIVDLYEPSLNRLSLPSKAAQDFQLLGHRVEFQGYCRACRGRSSGKKHHKTPISKTTKTKKTWR